MAGLHTLKNRLVDTPLSPDGWDDPINFKTTWTRQEIRDLIKQELGCYEVAVKSWECLGKVYKINKQVGHLRIPDEMQEDDALNSSVLLLLDHGAAAFKDEARFPNGQEHFIGQWYRFDKNHSSRFQVNGNKVVLLPDTSLRAHIANPDLIENLALQVI